MITRYINARVIVSAISTLVVFSSFILVGDTDPRLSAILERLNRFNKEYTQQKAYLQFDKTVYSIGEDIWYKAYLISGSTHLPDTMSTNFIVQLVNARNVVVQSQLLRLKNGCANGDFRITDTVPEGNYQVKAFTVWMTNFDQSFIFTRNIYIRNPENKNFISAEDLRFNRHFNRERKKLSDKTDIQFLPEGGYMVEGLRSRVAFKAVSGDGKALNLSGVVKDDKGMEVAPVQTLHKGMGAFMIKPEKGRKYTAWVKANEGRLQKIALPAPLEHSYTMQVDNLSSADYILVKVRSGLLPTADEYANDVILLGHTRGIPCYYKVFSMNHDSLDIRIPKENFPTGIAQLTLFNGRGLPAAERLVFINHHDTLKFAISRISDSTTINGHEKLQVMITDNRGNPVKGNFSASAVIVPEANPMPESNIQNYLWLTSDLKGPIDDPQFYFSSTDASREEALDLLMMTNGWRRFDWNSLIAGKFPKITNKEEKGITIGGKITRNFFQIPVKQARVYLTILNAYNDYYSTVADSRGNFSFKDLDYNDTLHVVIEATKPTGKHNVVINIDETASPATQVKNGETFDQLVLNRGADWKFGKVKRRDNSQRDMERKKKLEKYSAFRLHSESDNVLFMDEIPDGYSDLLQVIQGRVPGVTVTGNSVLIRGVHSMFGSNEPLFLVDGAIADLETFRSINPKDVEFIEFLKGSNTAIYGIRGSNGVIAVYTKRGDFMKRGFFDFQMLAYYTPRKFYSPYITGQADESAFNNGNVTLAWNPRLIPDQAGISVFSVFNAGHAAYRIVIEGLSDDGKPGTCSEIIHP